MGILITALFILCIVSFFVGQKFASKPIDNKNEEIRKECEKLHNKEVQLELKLKNLCDDIK